MTDEQHNPWKTESKKLVYENPWIRVEHHEVINPSGNAGIYGKVHFRNTAVGVVPVDEEGNTWLVGQFRYPIGRYSWEIPEGGAPENTDPLDGAKRELLEETGLVAREWTKILTMYLSNSVSDEYAEIYLATQLEQHSSEPEETELLQLKKVALAEAYRMVDEGLITDSMSVAALLKVKTILL